MIPPDNQLSQTIVDTRKKQGLTQTQLSQKTGIAQCDISRIETGQANPSVKTLKRLAEGMGMTLMVDLIPAG